MSPRSAMLTKEARVLFWPWLAVMGSGLFPLLAPGGVVGATLDRVAIAAFWIGTPFLAALSFGADLQGGTLTMLLAQPIGRLKIWGAKWGVLAAALASVAALHALAWSAGSRPMPTLLFMTAAAWVVLAACSSTLGTLIARSAPGGFILTLFLTMTVLAAVSRMWFGRFQLSAPTALPLSVLVVLSCSALMLWLGLQRFLRFQAVAGSAGSDLMMATPVATGGIVDWLVRCRPRGVFVNLVRKELRLLWPVWMLALLSAVVLIGLAPLQLLPSAGFNPEWNPASLASIVLIMYGLTAGVLAGSLSIGEERQSGTHSWQMTLPVSPTLQWFFKVVAVLGTIAVSLGLLSALSSSLFAGSDRPISMFALLRLAAVFGFPAFWCGCAIKGTIRGALFAIPAFGAVILAAPLSEMFAMALSRSRVTVQAASMFHSFPIPYSVYHALSPEYLPGTPLFLMTGILLSAAIVAVIQSSRLFRREAEDAVWPLVRSLAWPFAAALGFSVIFQTLNLLTNQIDTNAAAAVRTAHVNVAALQLLVPTARIEAPRQLTPEEVTRVATSEDSRLWLENGRVFVFADPQFNAYTEVHLAGGWVCRAFQRYSSKIEIVAYCGGRPAVRSELERQ